MKWLDSLEKPVGLMVCYDVRARHVLMACRSLGILVPEEVAVIGVDNDEFLCELTSPPLSSVEQGLRAMGREAAALLDRLMAGEKPRQLKFVVDPEGIVSRQSSDAMMIQDSDVAQALRFIRQHAGEGIQVSDVVRTVAVSRSTLETRFKAFTGRTIHAEIVRAQVERAQATGGHDRLAVAAGGRCGGVSLSATHDEGFPSAHRPDAGRVPKTLARLRRPGIACRRRAARRTTSTSGDAREGQRSADRDAPPR